MPARELYTNFHEGLIDGAQVEDLRGRLERLGMSKTWSHLCGRFIPPLNLWCLRKSETGMLQQRAEDIAATAGWPLKKSAPAFVQALIDSGFIDVKDGVYYLHNFRFYHRKILGDRERKRADCSMEHSKEQSMESAPQTVPYRTQH